MSVTVFPVPGGPKRVNRQVLSASKKLATAIRCSALSLWSATSTIESLVFCTSASSGACWEALCTSEECMASEVPRSCTMFETLFAWPFCQYTAALQVSSGRMHATGKPDLSSDRWQHMAPHAQHHFIQSGVHAVHSCSVKTKTHMNQAWFCWFAGKQWSLLLAFFQGLQLFLCVNALDCVECQDRSSKHT